MDKLTGRDQRDDEKTVQLDKINELVDNANALAPVTAALAEPAEVAVDLAAVHAALVAIGLITTP